MTLYEYTALHNPMGSAQVVSEYGIRPQRHPKILSKQLAECVKRGGKEALDKITDIHPDLQLFQEKLDGFKKKWKEESETKSNACGCESHSNASGQDVKREIEQIKNGKENSKTEMLIIGGVILGTLALILRK